MECGGSGPAQRWSVMLASIVEDRELGLLRSCKPFTKVLASYCTRRCRHKVLGKEGKKRDLTL